MNKFQARRRFREVREIVNEWDPIGVFGLGAQAPKDEYECLVAPVLGMLAKDVSEAEIAEYLNLEMQTHFGISPCSSVAPIAKRLSDWREGRWVLTEELIAS